VLHQHPFIRITVSYALGLLAGYVYPHGWTVVLCICISLILSALHHTQRYRYHEWLSGLALYIALCGLGIFACITYPNPYNQQQPSPGYYRAKLLQDITEKPKTYQCIAQVIDTAGTPYKMILYVQKDSLSASLIEGSEMELFLTKAQAQTFAYYNKQSIYSSAYVARKQWKLLAQPPNNTLNSYARNTKQYLLGTLKQHTDSTGYALTSAITIGHKASLKGSTKQYFSASGASHLLAVSGLHVGIIYAAISLLLTPLRRFKKGQHIDQLLVVLLLWGYAFLCGLPPSIVRAVTMFSVGALGVITKQKSQSINNVCFTAFIMLLYNPHYLFDMGFQLSFSAVTGILLYVESRRSQVKSQCKVSAEASKITNRLLTWVKDMCGISLVAQLATLPLILYYFGTFPTYFLLTNLVMIPLGTLLVYACLLLFILSPTPLASWLEWPITFLTSSMQTVTQFISTMPGAQLTNLHIGLFQAACLYALLFCLYRFYLHPMPKTLYPVLWSIIAGLVIW
jgi:competence protein ComEC